MVSRFILASAGFALLATACDQRTEAPDPAQSADAPESAPVAAEETTLTAVTTDGVTIYGEPYFGDLDTSTPLIMLFHQGGSSGRGEYASIATWLNEAGYRAIAWDQRSGGDTHGQANRTVDSLPDNADPTFCEAAPDLQAALDLTVNRGLADKVVVWGSSYSGSLIFQLAAEDPDRIAGVIAFSPASGGPMANCRAAIWAGEISAPIMVFRPASEMGRASSQEQREILTVMGADFRVVENGVHGSSMLVDERTGADMSATRAEVLAWLDRIYGIDR